MAKGVPNKRHTGEFKQMVVETMMKEKLSYTEAARQFEVSCHKSVAAWERTYLMEGSKGLYVERRGRGSKGRPKTLPKPEEKVMVLQELRREYKLDMLLEIAQLPRATYYYHCKNQGKIKGLAACITQTASPFGCLNDFY